MIIAHISDTHIALDTPDSDQRIQDFERTIAHINALEPAPDIIIHSGDIVQNGRADEYQCAAEILQKAKPPVYLMVGNKDDRSNLRKAFSSEAYLESGGEFITYTIDDFAVRLVVLDTLNPGSNKGEFCEKRVAGLIDTLEADPDKPTAVFAHHPPFVVTEGPDPVHFESSDIMQRFRSTLQRYKSIIAIYCGHVHRGVAGHVGDIPVLVMTSIATTLRRGEYPSEMQSCPVYHVHTYQPDWGFTTVLHIVRD